MSTIQQILQQYWGYQHFRGNQQQVIEAVLSNKNVLAILPTGGGKSLCYQVPAMAKEGVCIVISPLVALMKDQVSNLQQKNIKAVAITGNLPYQTIEKILVDALHGKYKFIYTSPERLNSYLFKKILPQLPINLIAVDEAHCISQWGHDFRPAYHTISSLLEIVNEVPVIAVTASATLAVQEEIVEQLKLKNTIVFKESLYKPNISYSAFKTDSKVNKVIQILQNVAGSSIIYCSNRKQTKRLHEILQLQNISAAYYHAGLEQLQREETQENWINNKTRVIISTNAFGMGIDKPNVRTVIHFDVPDNVENYYQEAGRAGRDQQKAYAVLLYNQDDITRLQALPSIRFPSLEFIKHVYQNLANFLQIAVGNGEGMYYNFDLLQFCKVFNYDVFSVISVLKALEKNGHIVFNEQAFIGSKISLTTDRFTLEQVEKNNEDFDIVLKTLLRTYEGIFDNETIINEKLIAKVCKTSVEKIIIILQQLQQNRLLFYQPSKNTPQIYFNYNRASANYVVFDEVTHLQQKKLMEQKTHALMQYVTNTIKCRSVWIQQYFNDTHETKCGICDNCLATKQKPLSTQIFEEIQHKIYASHFPLPVKELVKACNSYNKEHVWQVIQFLEDKKLLKTLKDGFIHKL